MPKVKEGYFEEKRDFILDAAEQTCREKSLFKMTMKDIIKASGLSPGAVYASFSNIDEVIIALINRLSIKVDYQSVVAQIMQEGSTPEGKIEALVSYFIELVHLAVTSYGKILFELGSIYIDAQRRSVIEAGMIDLQFFNHVLVALMDVIEKNIDNGYFKPLFSKENIYAVVFSFFDGFVRDLTLVKCYQLPAPGGVTFEERDVSKVMASSIIHLLNRE